MGVTIVRGSQLGFRSVGPVQRREIISHELCGAMETCGAIEVFPSNMSGIGMIEAKYRHHIIYIIEGSGGQIILKHTDGKYDTQPVLPGAGLYMEPGETFMIESGDSDFRFLRLTFPSPPASLVSSVYEPYQGYLFSPDILPVLSGSAGRVRTFCVNFGMPPFCKTRSAQAGLMRYGPGSQSPYHMHLPDPAKGCDLVEHFYMMFRGNGQVRTEDGYQDVGPEDLVWIPQGVRHQLIASESGLDYFEFQTPLGFITTMFEVEDTEDARENMRWRTAAGSLWTQS